MKITVTEEVELDVLTDKDLIDLIAEASAVLKSRSCVVSDTPKPKKAKRGRRPRTDLTKLDEFLKENYSKMSVQELIKHALKQGIKTDDKQIYYRKNKLGLFKGGYKKNPNVKQDPLDFCK